MPAGITARHQLARLPSVLPSSASSSGFRRGAPKRTRLEAVDARDRAPVIVQKIDISGQALEAARDHLT